MVQKIPPSFMDGPLGRFFSFFLSFFGRIEDTMIGHLEIIDFVDLPDLSYLDCFDNVRQYFDDFFEDFDNSKKKFGMRYISDFFTTYFTISPMILSESF